MGIREELLRRGQVPQDEVDDVIAEAGRLQEHERALAENRATREELDRVAGELDISPEYVERALKQREEARRAAAQRVLDEAAAMKASAQRRKVLGLGALGVAGVLGASLLGLGWIGSDAVSDAAAETAQAEAQLTAVLERQASLAPQLVGLAGGDPGQLSSLAAKVREAEDLSERLAASDALSIEMATTLGGLPAPENDATAQLRLNLQYEVTGSQNRITVESRRHQEAVARWEQAAGSLTGKLAVGLGLAEGP